MTLPTTQRELSRGLLAGVRVLDLSRILAGPWCTQMLGDLGADVIKVERPGSGDDTRAWGPPFFEDGLSAYFLCANRNKRGITLDFKEPRGLELLRELIARSDVLIENFRAGTLEALGLGWDELRVLRADLVYCTITGFGHASEFRDEPGYDFLLQARGGLMSVTGPAGEPHKVGVALCDLVAGQNAATSIVAALYAREKGRGAQRIDVSLFDSQVAMLANVASNFLVSGERPLAYGNGHPNIVPYQAFEAADAPFAVGVGNDAQWSRLCSAVGHGEWITDERFATNPARVTNRDELVPLLETLFATRTRDAWLQLLHELSIPCAPIQAVDEVFADPRARDLRQEVDGVPLVRSPLAIPTAPAEARRAPPRLGQHTDEVLGEVLGISREKTKLLRERRVV